MTRIKDAKLIGICGVMNAGKDTVANLIIARRPRELRRYAFASPLKAGVKAMFDWTDEDIENRQKKEAIDPRWGFSPRTAMQKLGTEYGRECLRSDIWVHAALNKHLKSLDAGKGTIITDVRFENEAAWVRLQPDSILIHVMNPEHDYTAPVKHVSENGVAFCNGDVQIQNDKRRGFAHLHDCLLSHW